MAKRIRILCTSDLHGAVYPYTYADATPAAHGIARLKTLIDSLRDEDTILIDNGDTIEGNPLTLYHYTHHHEKVCPVSRAMHMLSYDYVNVGNHDFNEGQQALFTHLEGMGAPCITSNFVFRGKSVGNRYEIIKIADKRIALFGLTTQYIPHWETEAHLKDITFPDALATAKETVEALLALPRKEAPDYIVCVYHGGFECDPETGKETERFTGENEGYRILTQVPEIDVLLAGHQHRTYCGIHGKTAYTMPGANGAYLACVDIDPETDTITPALLAADTDPDEDILMAIKEDEDACQRWLDQTLGTCNIDLKVYDEEEARLHKGQIVTFLNRVQMHVTGAQLSGAALFIGATGFEKEITMRDLVSTYIFPNTLTVKQITGKTLRAYLEKCAEFWTVREDGTIGIDPAHDFPTPGHFNYDMVDGVSYTIKVSQPQGARIASLTRDGKDVKDDDVFTIVVNNYRAAGGGDYDMIAQSPTIKEDLKSMVGHMADYIREHPVIDFAPVHNVTVIV